MSLGLFCFFPLNDIFFAQVVLTFQPVPDESPAKRILFRRFSNFLLLRQSLHQGTRLTSCSCRMEGGATHTPARIRGLPQADLACCLLVPSAPTEPMVPAALLSSMLCFPSPCPEPCLGILSLLARALLAQPCSSQPEKFSCPPALPRLAEAQAHLFHVILERQDQPRGWRRMCARLTHACWH